ncbi:hypothetical protein BDF14DRAFT_1830030, partial [Spinellus fusiger]
MEQMVNQFINTYDYLPPSGTEIVQEDYCQEIPFISFTDTTVSDILNKYHGNDYLLKHILEFKAQEDYRQTEEEFRIIEQRRLQHKHVSIELNYHRRSKSEPSYTQDNQNSMIGKKKSFVIYHLIVCLDPLSILY